MRLLRPASTAALFVLACSGFAQSPPAAPRAVQGYSVTILTHRVQALADGNVLDTTTTEQRARDSAGRTWTKIQRSDSSSRDEIINLRDPVAGYTYEIHPQRRAVVRRRLPAPLALPPVIGGLGIRPTPFKLEVLGTRVIAGEVATGTRRTTIVPAGAIGNLKPITSVYEQWADRSLVLMLESHTQDGRTGAVSDMHVENLEIGDPAAELFQIPADYQLLDATPSSAMIVSSGH